MVHCFDLSSYISGPSLPFMYLSTVASLPPLGVCQPSSLLWRSFFVGDSVRDVLSGEGGGVSGRATHRRDTGVAVERAKVQGKGHVCKGMLSLFVRAAQISLAHLMHRSAAVSHRCSRIINRWHPQSALTTRPISAQHPRARGPREPCFDGFTPAHR